MLGPLTICQLLMLVNLTLLDLPILIMKMACQEFVFWKGGWGDIRKGIVIIYL
jgi:hypothetical protein